jgi:hypothetical protein
LDSIWSLVGCYPDSIRICCRFYLNAIRVLFGVSSDSICVQSYIYMHCIYTRILFGIILDLIRILFAFYLNSIRRISRTCLDFMCILFKSGSYFESFSDYIWILFGFDVDSIRASFEVSSDGCFLYAISKFIPILFAFCSAYNRILCEFHMYYIWILFGFDSNSSVCCLR